MAPMPLVVILVGVVIRKGIIMGRRPLSIVLPGMPQILAVAAPALKLRPSVIHVPLVMKKDGELGVQLLMEAVQPDAGPEAGKAQAMYPRCISTILHVLPCAPTSPCMLTPMLAQRSALRVIL